MVEMHLGDGAGGIKCVAARVAVGSGFGRGMGDDLGPAGSAGASWVFDSKKQVCGHACFALNLHALH